MHQSGSLLDLYRAHHNTCENLLDKTVSVHISLLLVDRLRSAILAAPLSAEGRREEIGGLLLGSQEGDRHIFVEEVELLPSQHHHGLSYDFSRLDCDRLARRLQWWSKPGNSRQVVGLFRSKTGPSLSLDQADQNLFSRYFSNPGQVFLLVRPSDDGTCTAGFFFGEEGRFAEKKRTASFLSTVCVFCLPSSSGNADPLPPGTVGSRRFPVSTAAAVLAFLLLPLLALYAHRTNAARTRTETLALHVGREGSAMRVDWDRNLPWIETAQEGVLFIRDGTRREKLTLDAEELRHGGVEFWPKSSDVSLRLQVSDGLRIALGSVHTLADWAPAEKNDAEDSIAGLPVIEERIKSSPLAQPVPTVLSKSKLEGPKSVVVTSRPVPRLQPHVIEAKPIEPNALANASLMIPGIPGSDGVPAATVILEPVSQPFVIPARPVRQTAPALPRQLRQTMTGVIPVDLRISIDKVGNVAKTELLSKTVDSALAEIVVKTASHWDFVPARFNNRPVSSEILVHLSFGHPN